MVALRAGENGYQRWLVQCTPHVVGRNSAHSAPAWRRGLRPAPFLPPLPTATASLTLRRGHQFSSRRKRSNALRGDERRGTRKGRLRFLRMSSARGVALARALVVVEWTSSSFRCRSSGGRGGALRGSCGLPVRDAAVPLRGWRCLYRIHFPEKAGPSREDVLVNCY